MVQQISLFSGTERPTIVSASRRTDLPGCYPQWLLGRLREGWCTVRNPFNPKQVRTVGLAPDQVLALVLWTKNPAPLLPHLPWMEQRGFRSLFQFTLNHYPAELEPHLPSLEERITVFRTLAGSLGSRRVIWRYDPILLTRGRDAAGHRQTFSYLCEKLEGSTQRVMVSLTRWYHKTRRHLARLAARGLEVDARFQDSPEAGELLGDLDRIAAGHGIELCLCAPEPPLSTLGLKSAPCIDAAWIGPLFGIALPARKDPGQRPSCGCARSVDIGANDSCAHGCAYCYATSDHQRAAAHQRTHDPRAAFMGMENKVPQEG